MSNETTVLRSLGLILDRCIHNTRLVRLAIMGIISNLKSFKYNDLTLTFLIIDGLGPDGCQIWQIWCLLICLSMGSKFRTLWAHWLSPKRSKKIHKVCWSAVVLTLSCYVFTLFYLKCFVHKNVQNFFQLFQTQTRTVLSMSYFVLYFAFVFMSIFVL